MNASGEQNQAGAAHRPAAIRISGLVKDYGRVRALAGIDLEVQQGEVFGFLGPNGAGKTTAIRCLLDLVRPTAGSMEVLGLDPRRDGPALRARLAYVPGELRLPERGTVTQLAAAIGRIRGGLDEARRDALARRLDLDLDRRLRELSSGNRRKVALLLAFLADVELLVLDEPTNGLDPLMQHEFLAMVREARERGTTVFLSSHVLSEVQRAADRVAVLRAGTIVTSGTVDQLRGRARQRVEAWFAADPPATELDGLPGLESVTLDGRRLTATVCGPVQPLLEVLGRHPVASLVVEEPDLEATFLDIYAGKP
ncbi:MAG: ATP-binding cassette domain-containing protein [Chloroflexi bacterium]|nr:ATP-binding cassette domain-containing protein [Chloroflexota bacterium]